MVIEPATTGLRSGLGSTIYFLLVLPGEERYKFQMRHASSGIYWYPF